MSTPTMTRTRVGLTVLERALMPLEDGFNAYWDASPTARRGMLSAARASMREFRSDFGYVSTPSLLTSPESQPKTGKSKVYTLTLMLVPARSVLGNACPSASVGCGGTPDHVGGCLNTAGKGAMDAVQHARMVRMAFMVTMPWEFGTVLAHEVLAGMSGHAELGLRLNCVSDIRWERVAPGMLERMHDAGVQLYDYTAYSVHGRESAPEWYGLTYSAKEHHDEAWIAGMVHAGHNVAVPVFWRKGEAFPSTYRGLPAIDGDKSDFRPDDPQGCVVLLRAKGGARKDTSGFVRLMVA